MTNYSRGRTLKGAQVSVKALRRVKQNIMGERMETLSYCINGRGYAEADGIRFWGQTSQEGWGVVPASRELGRGSVHP